MLLLFYHLIGLHLFDLSSTESLSKIMRTLENQMKYYLYFFRLIGQFPFKITDNGLVPSTLLNLYGLIPTLCIISSATFTATFTFANLGARDVTLRFAFFFLGMSLLGTMVIIPIRKARVYCNVFQRFNRVEEYFRHIGNAIDWRKNTFMPLIILFKELLITAVIIGTEYAYPYWHQVRLPTIGMIFYFIAMVVMTLVTINCGTYAGLITSRFDAINRELEKMGKDFESETIFQVDKVINNNKIFPICSLHFLADLRQLLY